jgi:hypothetical protein
MKLRMRRWSGSLTMMGSILSLLGCGPRADVGKLLLSISNVGPSSNQVVILDTRTGTLRPLCGSRADEAASCDFAQGLRLPGPFLGLARGAGDKVVSLRLLHTDKISDLVQSQSSGGILNGGSLSPSGNQVVFTQSFPENPSLFSLWRWDAQSYQSTLIHTSCTDSGGSAAYPRWNADETAVVFTCYKRNSPGGLKTTCIRYNIATKSEEILLNGDAVVSAVPSPTEATSLAVWTKNGLETVTSEERRVIVAASFAKDSIIPANILTWSSRPGYLVFGLSDKSGNSTIYAVNIITEEITKLRTLKATRILGIDGLLPR